MKNPWEEISLEDYENHMRLDSVRQLQALDALMKEQFEAYPVRTAMVLGVAGGNGLRHVRPEKYDTVYCVDINGEYLRAIHPPCPFLASRAHNRESPALTARVACPLPCHPASACQTSRPDSPEMFPKHPASHPAGKTLSEF